MSTDHLVTLVAEAISSSMFRDASVAAAAEMVMPIIEAERADAARAAWDACVATIRKCAPGCTDQCDLCDFRGDVLADLDVNPYAAEVESTCQVAARFGKVTYYCLLDSGHRGNHEGANGIWPVEAVQWTEDKAMVVLLDFTDHLVRLNDVGEEFYVYDRLHATWVRFEYGDWIIRGVQGEFYPCKSDIFEATYERVADWREVKS